MPPSKAESSKCLAQVLATYSPPSNHPARSPFVNCSNSMARVMVLYFMNLPSLHCIHMKNYLCKTAQFYKCTVRRIFRFLWTVEVRR